MDEITKKRNRIAEITSEMETIQNKGDLTPEDVTSINALADEYDKVNNEISALERMATITAGANASAGRKVQPAGAEQIKNKKEAKNHGFKNGGEFYKIVKAAKNGQVDERLLVFNQGQRESVGEDGGFLVPEEFSSEIQKKVDGDNSLLSRCRQIPMSTNYLKYPTNEIAPWDGNGIQAYWTAEQGQITKSKHQFKQSKLELEKLAVLVPATEELLQDAAAAEAIINREASDAIVNKLNSSIIRGSGAGQPQGIINSGFTLEVAAEGGQAADTVNYQNIVKMYSRAMPASQLRGVWLINAEVQEQLRLMEFQVGSSTPVPVYLPAGEASAQPFSTLMGRPVIPMMASMSALGDKGDIIFADLDMYHAGLRSGENATRAVSTHVYFDTDETAFKFTLRMDGRIPFVEPVTTEFGNYQVSGFVTLAAR